MIDLFENCGLRAILGLEKHPLLFVTFKAYSMDTIPPTIGREFDPKIVRHTPSIESNCISGNTVRSLSVHYREVCPSSACFCFVLFCFVKHFPTAIPSTTGRRLAPRCEGSCSA
jgi:hypothetical protein